MSQSSTNNDTLEQAAAKREAAHLEIAEVGKATENLKEAKERLQIGEEPDVASKESDYLTETRDAAAQVASSLTESVGNAGENAKEAAVRLTEDEKGNK